MVRSCLRAGLLAVVLLAAWPAAASTEFLAYEGRDSIHVGQGGEKKVVDGVELWMDGSPPRRFQVLGVITDERWKSGLYGLMQISRLQHDIAKEARIVGGDGVIITSSEDHVWGYGTSTYGSANYGNGWAFGSAQSYTHPYGTRATRYIVVKYLPEDPSDAQTEASPPPTSLDSGIARGAPRPSPAQQAQPTYLRPPLRTSVGQGVGTEVALEKQGGIMVAPVLINGTIQLKFAVDSGASDVSIPADVFLTLVRSGTIDSADYIGTEVYRLADGSTVPSARFRIRRLTVGDREIENVAASIADPRGELLLGQSFLNRFRSWSIDNQREVLILGEMRVPQTIQFSPEQGPEPTYRSSLPIAPASAASSSVAKQPQCGAIKTSDGVKIVPCKQ